MSGKGGGRRCVVGTCTFSALKSDYAVYSIQYVRDESVKKKWLQFVAGSRREGNFDPRSAKTVYVCDGHFHDTDFEQTQFMMYMSGHRKRAPELLRTAIPSRVCAGPPHFGRRAEDPNLQNMANCTLTAVDPISVASRPCASDSNAGEPVKKKPRRRSRYLAQKEVNSITEEYQEPEIVHKEIDCQVSGCLEPHSISMQTDKILLQHQQTQADGTLSTSKKTMRNKKLQFHYKGRNAATQTDEFEAPCRCQCKKLPTLKDKEVQTYTQVTEPEARSLVEDDMTDPPDDPNDPDWEPSPDDFDYGADDDGGCDDEFLDEEISPQEDRKYIVFERSLFDLFKFCPERHCGAPCKVQRSTARCHGSMLVVRQNCTLCNFTRQWTSQPLLGNLPAGNLLLSTGILFSSSNPTKVLRCLNHCNIQAITLNTFLNHQRFYMQPAIIREWRSSQSKAIQEAKARGKPLIIGGDARCDSPGHCAKFGTYTMMDLTSGKVIDIQIVQVTDVKNSNAMELQGLKQGLAFLYSQGLTVGTLITDRHVQVPKFLRINYPDIDHRFDVWHISKGVKKKLRAAGKRNGFEGVKLWQKSIVNHIYWTAMSTPSGDGNLMEAKFLSMTNHLINKHEGHGHDERFQRCVHGEIQREWLKEDSKEYDIICDIITSTRLRTAVKKMSPLEQTSTVESFHGVICAWAPKMLAYSYQGMKCRTFLAVFHFNENGNREQARTKAGKLQYSLAYPKQKDGGYTVKKVLTACTYRYVGQLVQGTVALAKEGDKELRHTMPELQRKDTLSSKCEQPVKTDAIEEYLARSRFGTSEPDTM